MRKETDQDSATSESMTLEEARAVMWLRNNYKPLGELLDKGYLNRARLEWAAERAYVPELRQAARVLLDWLNQTSSKSESEKSSPETSLPAIDIGMAVEQARGIPWPFKPFKGQPMGNLVDSKQLTLKDLGYAVENAWEERVRQAAVVMAAIRLNQAVKEPIPTAGQLKVVSGGRSYAEQRQYSLAVIQGVILGAVLSLLGLLMLWLILRPTTVRQDKPLSELLASPAGVVALILILVLTIGFSWLVNFFTDWVLTRLGRQIENYRKGQEGEERVIEIIRQTLDGHWTLFRNVVLPGRKKSDLDAVLVGPSGVWVLEVKAFSGEYRNIGEHWEYRAGNRWRLLKSSPSLQAQRNAVSLSGFLKADGIRQWVTPAVIWVSPESLLAVENPSVAVWTLDRIPEELGNIWQGQEVSEADRSLIIDKLTRLCQKDAETPE